MTCGWGVRALAPMLHTVGHRAVRKKKKSHYNMDTKHLI
jgi:hypothetical protein